MQVVGWAASLVLLLTIAYQVRAQWLAGPEGGASTWLFIGQSVASTGFVGYSVAQNDVVFIVTNSLLLLSGFVGLGICLHHRRMRRRN